MVYYFIPDEDIPTLSTWAAVCAKLFVPQVNSFLVEPDIFIWENVILPKLLFYIIRLVEGDGIARGVEERQGEEHGVMEHGACAREEREEGARLHGGIHHTERAGDSATAEKDQFLCRVTT